MFSVGVTDSVDENELRELSSNPKLLDETYFMSADFEGLQNVLDQLLTVSCLAIRLIGRRGMGRGGGARGAYKKNYQQEHFEQAKVFKKM